MTVWSVRIAVLIFCLPTSGTAGVLPPLEPFLVNHYTFDNPLDDNLESNTELDLGLDATPIQLINGAPRVLDGAWWGSQYVLETRQLNTGPNDDWKAGVMFSTSDESTLTGTAGVTGVTIMGWFKPLGTITDNPSPNTGTPYPFDYYNSFGLAGILRGDEEVEAGIDGHTVRALLEVINGRVTGLGRRLDAQDDSGARESLDDWYAVIPPGRWIHLTATFDFDVPSIRLYKNGLPLAAAPASIDNWETTSGTDAVSATAAGGIKLGGSFPDNSFEMNPFNGRIDEVMFFNKYLSEEEVAAQYQLVSDVPGDYNRNGEVDAADYSEWRLAMDGPEFGRIADGDGDGQTTEIDYEIWRANFGMIAGASHLGVHLPEPAALLMILVTAMCSFGQRRLARCRRDGP